MATCQDSRVLNLANVLVDGSLSPAQRLAALYNSLGQHPPAQRLELGTAKQSQAGIVLCAQFPLTHQLIPATQPGKQHGQLQLGRKHVAEQLQRLLEERQAEQELQEILETTVFAAASNGTAQRNQQGGDSFRQPMQPKQHEVCVPQRQPEELQHQGPQVADALDNQSSSAAHQLLNQSLDEQKHSKQFPQYVSQLLDGGQLLHQQLYSMFLQQQSQPSLQECSQALQHTAQYVAGEPRHSVPEQQPGFGLAGSLARQGDRVQSGAAAVGSPGNSNSNAADTANAVAANGFSRTASGSAEPNQPRQRQQQRHKHDLATDDADEWLPASHRSTHSKRAKRVPRQTAASACRTDVAAQQPTDNPKSLDGPGSTNQAAGSQEQTLPATQPRVRRNRVAEMQQSIEGLRLQLSELCSSNTTLRVREHQLEEQLVSRERQVTSMLAQKHQAAASHQASWQTAAATQQSPSTQTSQQSDGTAYKLSEPSLGYDPSVFKQDYLPTINGGIISPGVLPMFCPLPQTAVLRGAQNLTQFVEDARRLRAAHAGSEREAEVEQHLLTRIGVLQGLMRRYNVMNPVFMYQLRAINMSTGQPDTPPEGHWSAMAEVMRGLITSEEINKLKLAYRLFKASLRAIKKEQTWVVSQIVTTSQRMQSSAAACVQQQQDDGASSTSSSVGSFEGTSAATAETGLVRAAEDALSSAPQTPMPGGGGSSSSSGPAIVPLTEAMLLDQMQLQQQLDDLLHEMEQLLLREHDQHFMLLWSCAKMPGSPKVFMELLMASYPFLVNFHEILPHLLGEA